MAIHTEQRSGSSSRRREMLNKVPEITLYLESGINRGGSLLPLLSPSAA